MYRLFALPDYVFSEIKVPSWAYDKRRSPLYVRPEIEVCFERSPLDLFRGSRSSPMQPSGDEDDSVEPPGQEATFPLDRSKLDALLKVYGSGRKTISVTQPTVRHSYRPTKQQYDFRGNGCLSARGSLGAKELKQAAVELPSLLRSKVERKKTEPLEVIEL
eukprot:TRINITY_DN50069_c0_g1_i1.p1 TRINITY_DN50069_c0_g1~~TRINITY_DN50069_c0_g1_i1.p1  ORF type:complete len:161 (-),score=25.96 TRINITY_DN50069_c0_g1_i1:30-512(-)